VNGRPLPTNALPPSLHTSRSNDNWEPYKDQIQFETADLLYQQTKASASSIDKILKLWNESLKVYSGNAPFKNHQELYRTIDSTPLGNVRWANFKLFYQGTKPSEAAPAWMKAEYEVWFQSPRILVQNLISNPEFAKEFNYAPYQEYHGEKHRFGDFMSGNWAWKQAVSVLSNFFLVYPDKFA